MAKRFLKVTVARAAETDVYLCIDDEKTKLEPQALPGGKGQLLLSHKLRRAAESEAEDLWPDAWGDPDYSSHAHAVEVSEREASEYGFADLTESDMGDPAKEG